MSLWAWVDPGSWRFVQAVTMFGSVLVLGWGSELLSAAVLFAPPPETNAADAATTGAGTRTDNRIKNGWWRLAQLAFPLFLTISVFSRSVFGLPFLCTGLWKFGCVHTHRPRGTVLQHLCASSASLDGCNRGCSSVQTPPCVSPTIL